MVLRSEYAAVQTRACALQPEPKLTPADFMPYYAWYCTVFDALTVPVSDFQLVLCQDTRLRMLHAWSRPRGQPLTLVRRGPVQWSFLGSLF